MTTLDILKNAKNAKRSLGTISSEMKNKLLIAMADAIEKDEASILEANAIDVENAKDNINPVMIDRLKLTHDRIVGMANGIREIGRAHV